MTDLFGEEKATKLSSKYSPGFERFWSEYPRYRRKGKADAFKSWQKQNLEQHANALIEDVQRRKDGDKDWKKDGGKFVPLPTTFLNGRRWEDEVVGEYRPKARAPIADHADSPRQECPAKAAFNRVWLSWMGSEHLRSIAAGGKKATDGDIQTMLRIRDRFAKTLIEAWNNNESLVGLDQAFLLEIEGVLE